MFTWFKKIIESFYIHLCHSHRRQRKCVHCGRFLKLFDYYVIRDGREELKFCNSECGCTYIDNYSRNRGPYDDYRRQRVKSDEWF